MPKTSEYFVFGTFFFVVLFFDADTCGETIETAHILFDCISKVNTHFYSISFTRSFYYTFHPNVESNVVVAMLRYETYVAKNVLHAHNAAQFQPNKGEIVFV